MTKLIERQSVIPTQKCQTFSTRQDNQTAVSIQVYQGEGAQTKENIQIGNFELTGIAPGPRGKPQIEVCFSLDGDSIRQVTATDKASVKVEHVTIPVDKGRLTMDDIERMARAHQNEIDRMEMAERNRIVREQIEAKNKLEGLCSPPRSSLEDDDIDERIEEGDEGVIQENITKTLDWLNDNDDAYEEALDEKVQELKSLANPIMAKLYQGDGI